MRRLATPRSRRASPRSPSPPRPSPSPPPRPLTAPATAPPTPRPVVAKKKPSIKLKRSAKGVQPGIGKQKITAIVNGGGKVKFTLKGTGFKKNKNVKVKNGKAVYKVPPLGTGTYKVTGSFQGKKAKTKFEVYNSALSVNSTTFTFSASADPTHVRPAHRQRPVQEQAGGRRLRRHLPRREVQGRQRLAELPRLHQHPAGRGVQRVLLLRCADHQGQRPRGRQPGGLRTGHLPVPGLLHRRPGVLRLHLVQLHHRRRHSLTIP